MITNHFKNQGKRILILSANPIGTDQLRLDEEVRDIEEGLQRSRYRDQFKVDQKWAVRLRDMRRALLDLEPQILHFTGHGEVEGIMVEDKQGFATIIPPRALANLFRLQADKIECVVLSACHSDFQADAINKYIRYVISMPQQIKDKAALEFAVGFYDALGAGKTVKEAFEFGCNAIQQYCPDLPDYLYPRLQVNRRVKIKKKKRFVVPLGFLSLCLIIYTVITGLPWSSQDTKRNTHPYNRAEKATTATTIPETSVPEPDSHSENETVVYMTQTGKKYHRIDCRHLRKKIKTSLKDAVSRGLQPCKTCRPHL
jgi:hypothetical protein